MNYRKKIIKTVCIGALLLLCIDFVASKVEVYTIAAHQALIAFICLSDVFAVAYVTSELFILRLDHHKTLGR